MKAKDRSSGFSLIETMVCLVVSSLVLAATYYFFMIHHSSYKGQSERLSIEDGLRGTMDFVQRSMRQAAAFPFAVAAAGSLTFSFAEDYGLSSGGSATTLDDSHQNWTSNSWTNYRVVLTGGTGQNQVRTITANSSTQLTVSPAWATVPDVTSEYKIISDRQFSLSGTQLQYQNTTTGDTGIVADNISSFVAARTGTRVDLTMTAQTARALPDTGVVGTTTLRSSVDVRN